MIDEEPPGLRRNQYVLGVLIGSRGGLWFGARARAKWLKVLMAIVLIMVSIIYLRRSL